MNMHGLAMLVLGAGMLKLGPMVDPGLGSGNSGN